jgi:hypothetical protein
LLARLRAKDVGGARWVLGNCHAGLEQPALWPFREVAAQLARAPEFRAHTLGFAEALPALRGVPELHRRAQPGYDGSARNVRGIGFELYESFAELLRNPSQLRPLLIAIEDVHWADEASVALLDTLSRTARQHDLHVIATYRPEAVVAGRALRPCRSACCRQRHARKTSGPTVTNSAPRLDNAERCRSCHPHAKPFGMFCRTR